MQCDRRGFNPEKQRQNITSYKIDVEGHAKEVHEAKPFESIHVTLYLDGEIDEAKAIRAAELSFEKYCSVSITMAGCVNVTHSIVLNGKKL